jgi:NADH dehydrogenase
MPNTKINLPETQLERVVIVGGGFGGLQLARKLAKSNYQVVLIDRENYHQFQPLFYQVAMSGLEPSSIVFPFRRIFQKRPNVFIRNTEVTEVQAENKRILTPLGFANYDHLIIATGADTNFFGNEELEANCLPMKSVGEALHLRNTLLEDYERSLVTPGFDERQSLVDIVIVGGGPTGVELAGALAEMKRYVLPKDYPELNVDAEVDIYLIQAGPFLLKGMSEKSAEKSREYLEELGVKVLLNTKVTGFDGERVTMADGGQIVTHKVIWAAGIKGQPIGGLPESAITYGNRIGVDRFHRVPGLDNIYAVGDVSYMEEPDYPKGHPQVAQTAMQMGANLAKNFKLRLAGKAEQEFHYVDKGSMATIGRARAVVDLPNFHFNGFFAWLAWLVVHLFAILGTRNKLFVFINWLINYINYNQSLRLIIRPSVKKGAGGGS